VVSPATPEPITITSAEVLQPGEPVSNFITYLQWLYCQSNAPDLPNQRQLDAYF